MIFTAIVGILCLLFLYVWCKSDEEKLRLEQAEQRAELETEALREEHALQLEIEKERKLRQAEQAQLRREESDKRFGQRLGRELERSFR